MSTHVDANGLLSTLNVRVQAKQYGRRNKAYSPKSKYPPKRQSLEIGEEDDEIMNRSQVKQVSESILTSSINSKKKNKNNNN